jgi:hypothetical protein
MRTDGRTDRHSSFNSSFAVVHPRLKSFDWIGQFVNAQPTAVSTAIAKYPNTYPQHLQYLSNMVCQHDLAVSQPGWQQQWRSEARIRFLPLVYLNEKCVFLKSPRRLRLFTPATYRTKRSLFSKFSMSNWRTPWPFLSNYLQLVIRCLDNSVNWLGYELKFPGFESRRVATYFSLLRMVHIVYGARPASYWVDAGMLPQGHSGRSVMLTTYPQTQG